MNKKDYVHDMPRLLGISLIFEMKTKVRNSLIRMEWKTATHKIIHVKFVHFMDD